MPATGGIKLADANVWLAVAFSDHLHHAKARAWFEWFLGTYTARCNRRHKLWSRGAFPLCALCAPFA